MGIHIDPPPAPGEVALGVPLNLMFFNPGLLPQLGEGPVLKALAAEHQYKNDAIIDNHLRSVLFQVPLPGDTTCIEPVDPKCYSGVTDLAAIDVQRGFDHGMPNYNQLRVAYGLAPKASFAAVVGSGPSSENFPRDPKLTPGNEINQPAALDFTALFDKDGNAIDMTDDNAVENNAVNAKRRTPLAARLKAIYKNVNNLDAFTGMNAEPHVPGTEFGELQLAIWKKQFQALRDGDRFFFGNQPILDSINNLLGINFQRTLAQVIADNTDIPASDLQANVFFAPDEGAAAAKSGGASATKSHGNAPNGAGSNQLLARLKDEE